MITIKSGRHPLAVTLLAFCVLSGVVNLLAYSHSAGNVIRALPSPFGYAYYIVLAVGAVVALVGLWWPGITGPLLERSGYLMLTGLFAAYAVIAVAIAGPRALFTAGILLGFAVGSAARVVQIRRELRRVVAAATLSHSKDQLEDG